jgi:hypothetical protein
MLTTYILSLLAVVALCAFWAIFQVWLFKHDPAAERRSLKCGGCGREGECDGASADAVQQTGGTCKSVR